MYVNLINMEEMCHVSKLSEYKKYEEYLETLLLFTIAKETINMCEIIGKKRCNGCSYNSPNHKYHDCLKNSTWENFIFYYHEAINNLDYEIIPRKFEINVEQSQDIPSIFINKFMTRFNWDWWNKNDSNSKRVESKIKQITQILSIV